MSDPNLTALLERLAATAPEPQRDLVAGVHRRSVTRQPRRLAPLAVALATVVAVLLAVGVVALVHRDRPAAPATPPAEVDGSDALRAGRAFAQVFFSPDYRTVDAYSDAVEAGSSGTFRSDFAAKRGDLKTLLTQVRSVAQGRVLAAAVRDVTPSSATVLLAADQDVRNTTSRGRVMTNRYRIGLSMVRVDGRWLAKNLEPIVGDTYGTGCPDPLAGDRSELLSQTCATVERAFSFDYRTLDADLAAQRAVTTGPFTREIVQVNGPSIRAVAAREHTVVRATASTAAVEQQGGNAATVLVFVDQDVTVAELKQPRTDRNRLQVTMRRVDGRWLIAGIRAL